MAAGDAALRLLITGNATSAIAAVSSVTSMLGSGGLMGMFENIGTGSIVAGLGLQNMGNSGVNSMGAIMKGATMAGNALWTIAGVAALAGAAIALGLGVASVKMAADYQQSMNKVQALTGSTTDQMNQYDTSVKQLAVDAGVAPKALSDGLYNVLSASYRGATAIQVLTLATEDAKIGMTSAATVTTDALTNILRSFGVQTKDITAANGEMLQTVTLGKSTMEQYATTIVKSASAAVQFRVSMETMNAAWATMTSSGIRAAQASTDFQQSLKVMYGNIGTVTKSLEKNGIAFNETAFNAMDYGHKVLYLNTALQQANDKHVHITGVTLQAAQAISTISKHIGDYNSNLAILSDKQAMAQKTQQAWAITQSGFNQTMDRVKAALDVLMISIGQKLLPVLSKLGQQIVPLITQFTDWLIKSGALQNGIDYVVGAITNMIAIGSAVVSFFQNNQAAMALLQATLIVVAVIIGVVMVIALYSYAAAAWVAAAANIAAFWPVYLVILIVIVVIALVILAVQHWGQIAHWLQGVWAAIAGFFVGLWGGILAGLRTVGAFFASVWATIVTAFHATVAFLINAAKIGFAILLVSIFGPILAVAGLFIWLYQHNTYFQKLVDAIVGFFKGCFTWLHNAWNTAITWLAGVWNTILTDVKTAWQKVSDVFSGIWTNYIAGPLGSLWNSISGWLGHVLSESLRGWMLIWQKVSGVFSTIWNTYIAKPLGSVWTSISKWFSDLGTSAQKSGENFISMLVKGITSGAGAIWNAVSGIAKNIWSALGFHSPTEKGPGSDADRWMPNLISMLSAGLIAGVPQIRSAVSQVASPLASLSGGAGGAFSVAGSSASGGSAGNAFALSGGQTIVVQVQPTTASIHLDNRKVGESVMNYAAKEVRIQGGLRSH